MNSIRRTAQPVLRASHASPGSILSCNVSLRSFSHTCAQYRGALPVFLEPSSPALSTLLSDLNAKVLAPCHYTKEQSDLVYKTSNKAKLEAEPVEITLGDVTLPLVHINRNTDQPNRWRTVESIVKESETAEDFENALRMLEGFENAGIKVKVAWQSKLIRRMGQQGFQDLVVKMVQRGKRNGVTLKEKDVVATSLRTIYSAAPSAGWDNNVTARAYKYATQVVELMDESHHHGDATKGKERDDHRGNPKLIAVPTSLVAALALKHGEHVEQVKKLASRLISALQQDEFDSTLTTHGTQTGAQESDFKNGSRQAGALSAITRDVIDFIPIWHALKTSRGVLGANMPNAVVAKEFENKTLSAIENGIREAQRLQMRGGVEMRHGAVGDAKEMKDKCQ